MLRDRDNVHHKFVSLLISLVISCSSFVLLCYGIIEVVIAIAFVVKEECIISVSS